MQPDKNGPEWLFITIFAFLGGIVANIVVPSRRGAWGFLGAAVIGVFCGCCAGLSAQAFGANAGWQFIISAMSAVIGDRVLTAVLMTFHGKNYNIAIHGGQNNIGDNDIGGNQNNE